MVNYTIPGILTEYSQNETSGPISFTGIFILVRNSVNLIYNQK